MLRRSREPDPRQAPPAPHTVRVLRNGRELAEASARAAVHASRLLDRLEARAACDARTAEHQADDLESRSGTFSHPGPDGAPDDAVAALAPEREARTSAA
jgi:hypothetical protein